MFSIKPVLMPFLMVAAVMCAVAVPADAQSRRGEPEGRPSRLTLVEEQLADLRRLVADLSVKISVLDRELRTKTGRLEELEFKNRRLEEALSQAQNQILLMSSDLREQQAQLAARPTLTAPVDEQAAADGVADVDAPTGGVSSDAAGESVAQQPDVTEQVSLPNGTPAEQFDFAFDFVRSNDLETGERLMADLVTRFPADAVAGNAYFWLGRINLQNGRPAIAAQNLLNVLDNFPDHPKRADSFVDLAAALIALEVPSEACDALYEFELISGNSSPRLLSRARQLASQARCD